MQTRQFNKNNGRFTRILVQATKSDTAIMTALQARHGSASYCLCLHVLWIWLTSRQYSQIDYFLSSCHFYVWKRIDIARRIQMLNTLKGSRVKLWRIASKAGLITVVYQDLEIIYLMITGSKQEPSFLFLYKGKCIGWSAVSADRD